MRLKATKRGAGKHVWMTAKDLELVLDQLKTGSRFWLAMSLLGKCGLKTAELTNVHPDDLVDDGKDDGSPVLLDVDGVGKNTRKRRVPIPDELVACINMKAEHDSGNTITVSHRTLRNWTKRPVDDLIRITENEDWKYLSPMSFRHSWADILLQDGISPKTVMRWGGWNSARNFHDMYLADNKKSDYSKVYESDLFNK